MAQSYAPRSWEIRQSAVLPYRFTPAGNLVICLITSRSQGRWIVPKGYLEPGMTPWDSAAKEALEEAGVVGQVSDQQLGYFLHQKSSNRCRVEVYPLEVTEVLDDWEEADERERLWLPAEQAARRISIPELARMIREFATETAGNRHNTRS